MVIYVAIAGDAIFIQRCDGLVAVAPIDWADQVSSYVAVLE